MAVPKNTFSKPSNLVGGQVLWGRVLIIGGVLVLAFVIGILIGGSGSDGVSRDAYNDAITQRDKAEQEREQLKQDLQLARSTTPATTSADAAGAGETQTYTVKDGDTWASISKKFYGDSSLASEIWDANNMTKDTKLKSGMTLEIPPKPASASTTTTTTTKPKSKSTTTTTTKPKSSSKNN
ncbi:MAG: LysM domain-containing protein [Acidimicrobiia bacterium]